jgi:hypothetical protein
MGAQSSCKTERPAISNRSAEIVIGAALSYLQRLIPKAHVVYRSAACFAAVARSVCESFPCCVPWDSG